MENNVSDEGAVEGLVWSKHGIAERVAHRGPRGLARLSDGVGDVVGVDDRKATIREVVRRRRLSRTDTPGDRNYLHARTLAITCDTTITSDQVLLGGTRSWLLS